MEEISFRLADDADTDSINQFYNTIYKSSRNHIKFDWEFNSAPAGKAIYVIAEQGREIIGTQCVIPYYVIHHDGTVILSGKSEDTLVSPQHRGKQIFEKMYALLLDACRQKDIAFIWGFTYATRPFIKLGFQTPYRSKMGLLVIKPFKSAAYFAALSSKNTLTDKAKILGLSFFSKARSFALAGASSSVIIDSEPISLNTDSFNYLQQPGTFGLKLDTEFLAYRVTNNPYNKNYTTINYRKNGSLLASMVFNITSQKVGYIIHLYVAEQLNKKEFRDFFKTALASTELKNCATLRFWGFSETQQNRHEIEMLGHCGFIFLNRGITFVWLPLYRSLQLDPKRFVLSRMASQGID